MKRPTSAAGDAASPPVRSRRARALSADERELWEHVARSAKPLRKPRAAKKPEAAAPIEPPPPATMPPMAKLLAASVAVKAPLAVKPPPLATLARRERSRIARGRTDIDARLDLHGMTQARAHGVLFRFLARAQDDGLTLVLVITGKGTGKGGEGRGVLRQQVPEWLGLSEFRSFVVGFEEAHAAHGGGGALYVRVRRAR